MKYSVESSSFSTSEEKSVTKIRKKLTVVALDRQVVSYNNRISTVKQGNEQQKWDRNKKISIKRE